MVYLSRIYTKTGDQGETSLGDGSRVPKTHPRIAACGDVDELNAALGLLLACDGPLPDRELVRSIQNDLFDLGADLCVPTNAETGARSRLRIEPGHVERLEQAIDRLNATLQPLTSFVLPGGNPAAAATHSARTVCRRAERTIAALATLEAINPQILIYLNRLSDYLFVLARTCNDGGRNDVLWQPGQSVTGFRAGGQFD